MMAGVEEPGEAAAGETAAPDEVAVAETAVRGAFFLRTGAPALESGGGPLGMAGERDAADAERSIASSCAEIVVVEPESARARSRQEEYAENEKREKDTRMTARTGAGVLFHGSFSTESLIDCSRWRGPRQCGVVRGPTA
jgi:hypothetical protein